MNAMFAEKVTNKLVSAAVVYDNEGNIEGIPLGEIGTSIEEALESIHMISKVSKDLKGNLTGRMRAAIDIVRSGTEELQRRYMAQEREMRGFGTLSEETAAFRRRAFAAEAEVLKLRKELEVERETRFFDIEERPVRPSSLIHQMEMEVEVQPRMERKRSPLPLPQRITRARGKAQAGGGKKEEGGKRVVGI